MGKHGCVIAAASLAGWLGGSLGGCGFDTTPMGSAVCVDGQSAECACEDGSRGLHSCSQGEFGACACGPADTGAAPPDDASGSGNSPSGSASAGSSGGAIDGAAGASGGAAGSAAGPGAGAGSTAGSGAPHPGGEGGSTGDAGSGGSGGSAGGAGGDGGRGGTGAGDPIQAPPGTAYGFCAAQADCKDGLVCTASLDNSASGYCAPFCMFNGGGGGGAGGCEQPTSGEVQAQCAPLVGMCLLTACQNKDCPARMECVQSTLPFGQQDVASNCRYLTK